MTEFETPSDASGADDDPTAQPSPDQSATPATGDEDIDEVLVTLEGLEDLPVSEHPPVYSRAHDALRDSLAGKADPAEES